MCWEYFWNWPRTIEKQHLRPKVTQQRSGNLNATLFVLNLGTNDKYARLGLLAARNIWEDTFQPFKSEATSASY
jgi:hypothetical protein